ncbi:flagellar biosynthesis repressor FlbT [Minwuia sp.]|uniref:flagellar biosynthesis repressor FlbT n=1 Tax=Minwuia sp. TaxID=2493630 RepID=UPI003A91730F
MALKLTLKPAEKFVINGAVIANGDRRATLVLHNKASILRERDIMKAEDVDTPAKRIYFAIMTMYLDEKVRPRFYEEFVRRMSEFMGAISDPDALATCVAISQCVMERQYYKGLTLCRRLLEFEKERLNYEPAGV